MAAFVSSSRAIARTGFKAWKVTSWRAWGHLAYSMGYLALLTRVTPELIAAERAKLAALSRSLIEEMTAAAKTTAVYHQKLSDRLSSLPGEIAQGR